MEQGDGLADQATAEVAAALTEADGRAAVWAGALIVLGTTESTALGTGPVLLPADVAEIALLSGQDGGGIGFGEVGDAVIAATVVLCHGPHQDGGDFDRDARVPFLW